MLWYVLAFVLVLPVLQPLFDDPAPGISKSKDVARNLDCETLSEQAGHQRFPGLVSAPSARGAYLDSRVVACKERLVRYGERPARDEAVLTSLSRTALEVAEATSALGLEGKTWLVEAHYPDVAVAHKLTAALKVALFERGQRVSDRAPTLAAGDVLVLGGMAAAERYELACGRYRAQGSLSPDDALLVVALPEARATVVHAGVCAAGGWRWLR